jgi:type I restriction enzyme M protein
MESRTLPPQPAAKKNKDGSYKEIKEKKAATPDDVVCDLLPVSVVIDAFFIELKTLIQAAEERIGENEAQLNELLEEEAENYLDADTFENKTLSDGNVKKKLKELKVIANTKDEVKILERYLNLKEEIADAKRVQKVLKYELLSKLVDKYKQLTEAEIKELVIEKKWFTTLAARLDSEMQRISQTLTTSISDLAERYGQTLPEIDQEISGLEDKVKKHLAAMGFNW